MSSIEIIQAPLCELGEAPVWDSQNQCLFWIDIVKKIIYCLNGSTQEVESMILPFAPSAIVPNQSGGQLLVTKKGLALMDFKKRSYTSLPTVLGVYGLTPEIFIQKTLKAIYIVLKVIYPCAV